MFKSGDVVEKKSGKMFSSGGLYSTIREIRKPKGRVHVWLKESGVWIEPKNIQKVSIVAGARVKNRHGNPFSNGEYVNTVERVEIDYRGTKVYFNEVNTWSWVDELILEKGGETPYEDREL